MDESEEREFSNEEEEKACDTAFYVFIETQKAYDKASRDFTAASKIYREAEKIFDAARKAYVDAQKSYVDAQKSYSEILHCDALK
jgi:hypothetical protein